MRRGVAALVLAAVLAIAAAGFFFLLFPRLPGEADLETVDLSARPSASAPAMCPWRDPARDLAALFPGARSHGAETLIVSSLRPQIARRLGPGAPPLRENSLYVHRVGGAGGAPEGTILVQRAAGRYGAIEVVVGVDVRGRVVGIRLQRQREPKPIAHALTAPDWLAAFAGTSADAPPRLGKNIPGVAPAARPSAEAVAQTVRTLLAVFAVAEKARAAHQPSREAGHHH